MARGGGPKFAVTTIRGGGPQRAVGKSTSSGKCSGLAKDKSVARKKKYVGRSADNSVVCPKTVRDTPRVSLDITRKIFRVQKKMTRMAAENNNRALRKDAMSVRKKWVVNRCLSRKIREATGSGAETTRYARSGGGGGSKPKKGGSSNRNKWVSPFGGGYIQIESNGWPQKLARCGTF